MSLKVDRILGPGGERGHCYFPENGGESLARHYFRGIRRSAPSILHYKRPLSPQSLVRLPLRPRPLRVRPSVRPFHHSSGYRLQNAMLTDVPVVR